MQLEVIAWTATTLQGFKNRHGIAKATCSRRPGLPSKSPRVQGTSALPNSALHIAPCWCSIVNVAFSRVSSAAQPAPCLVSSNCLPAPRGMLPVPPALPPFLSPFPPTLPPFCKPCSCSGANQVSLLAFQGQLSCTARAWPPDRPYPLCFSTWGSAPQKPCSTWAPPLVSHSSSLASGSAASTSRCMSARLLVTSQVRPATLLMPARCLVPPCSCQRHPSCHPAHASKVPVALCPCQQCATMIMPATCL